MEVSYNIDPTLEIRWNHCPCCVTLQNFLLGLVKVGTKRQLGCSFFQSHFKGLLEPPRGVFTICVLLTRTGDQATVVKAWRLGHHLWCRERGERERDGINGSQTLRKTEHAEHRI